MRFRNAGDAVGWAPGTECEEQRYAQHGGKRQTAMPADIRRRIKRTDRHRRQQAGYRAVEVDDVGLIQEVDGEDRV